MTKRRDLRILKKNYKVIKIGSDNFNAKNLYYRKIYTAILFQMKTFSYKENVIKSLNNYFDIKEEAVFYSPLSFEFQAIYKQINQKYVFTKEWTYEEFNSNEYLFFIKLDALHDLHDIKNCVTQNYQQMMKLDSNVNHSHMSSYITFLVEVASAPSAEVVKLIEKFDFYKSFLFGFKGWLNTKLIVVDSTNGQGFANKFGKKDLPQYLQMAHS